MARLLAAGISSHATNVMVLAQTYWQCTCTKGTTEAEVDLSRERLLSIGKFAEENPNLPLNTQQTA